MARDEYDFWLFDLDGTLVDVKPEYAMDLFETVGDRLGREFTEREVRVLWYGVGGSRDRHLREWGIDPENFWSVFHDVEDAEARAEHTYLYDDAADFVGSLSAPVGLVTHCQPYLTGPVLDALDIRDWFDAVVCCTEETGWKPDPTPVELVMEDLGVAHNGHEGVLAGDDPDDVHAAKGAGLDAVHVARHDHGLEDDPPGDYRVTSFSELSTTME